MKNPLISVVLPVYNASGFLIETLESISAQTFQDWELIAIDDGSSDASLSVMKTYAAKEPRMRIVTRPNQGLVATLNEGISLAAGKWIARMDADDICLPERFAKQLAWLEKEKADICGGVIKRIGAHGGGNSWVFPTSHEGICTWMLFRSAFSHPTILVNREVAKRFPYDQAFAHSEDYELWTRMALAGVRMTNLPENILLYRIHASQVSQARHDIQTDVRLRITADFWKNSPIAHDLVFRPCLVDERVPITAEDFLAVMKSLRQLEERIFDIQGKAAIQQHRVWFLYRSVNLGNALVMPELRKLQVSALKKLAVALLAFFRAGSVIDYFRKAEWIRYLPLHWFF